MPIPLLEYTPVSKNHRVEGFVVPGDEQPKIYTTDNLPTNSDMDALIMAAYRQVYHEQQMLEHYRQRSLESQLRAGQITVREFMRGLVLSDNFRRLVYDNNNNYRFVEICVQRLLGRDVYSGRPSANPLPMTNSTPPAKKSLLSLPFSSTAKQPTTMDLPSFDGEKYAWSIVLATKGIKGFIDELLSSEEYLSNFGEDTVPYQRRRILPQRAEGEVTFEHMARYGADFRDRVLTERFTQQGQVPLYNQFSSLGIDFSDRATRLQILAYAGVIVALLILWFLAGSLDYR